MVIANACRVMMTADACRWSCFLVGTLVALVHDRSISATSRHLELLELFFKSQ